MSKLRVGVIYGSRSVEHEVSVITALQAMDALDPARYDVIPLYITKQGEWLTGPSLRKIEAYHPDSDLRRSLTRASLLPVHKHLLILGDEEVYARNPGGVDSLERPKC